MKDTQKSSFRKQLSLQQLLHLKRLEKPNPEFWASFERELQQKQLQALMRPSFWERVRAVFLVPRLATLATLSAVAVICAAAGWAAFSFNPDSPSAGIASHEDTDRQAEAIEVAESADASPEPKKSDAPRRTDALFVVDALVPEEEQGSSESFRTVAVPETLRGASDSSAYYVVNAFTTDVYRQIGAVDVPVEF